MVYDTCSCGTDIRRSREMSKMKQRSIFVGIVGVLVGPFVGAVLGELAAQRDLGRAGRVGLGVSIGMALGAAAKLTLGFAMIGLFLLARFV